MGIALFKVPARFTSSTPPVMWPWPSAVKLPVRESGVAEMEPGVKTSPLVTKAYWPFKLAALKLPVGGGGVTLEPPLPQAALQRATAAVRAKRKRFIAHPAAPQFERATLQRRGSSRSLGCCERRPLACPFARCGLRKLCHYRKPNLLR